MRYLKLSFALFIALILLTVFTVILPFPQIAHAQEPECHSADFTGETLPDGFTVITGTFVPGSGIRFDAAGGNRTVSFNNNLVSDYYHSIGIYGSNTVFPFELLLNDVHAFSGLGFSNFIITYGDSYHHDGYTWRMELTDATGDSYITSAPYCLNPTPTPTPTPSPTPTPETITETTCITGTDITIHASSFLGVDVPSGIDVIDPGNMLGPADGITGQIGDYSPYGQLGDYYTCAYFDLPGTISTINEGDAITITTQYERGTYQENLFTYPTNGQTSENSTHNLANEGWDFRAAYYYSSGQFTGTVGSLALCAFYSQIFGGWGYNTVDAITATVHGQYCHDTAVLYSPCATVQDYHFTGVTTDTWLLDGDAQIFSSSLLLNEGGLAAQNLLTDTITNNTYSAVISVSGVTADTDLYLLLNTITQTLSITQPGLYTSTFVITNASGTSAYALQNLSGTGIVIDWTCIYTGTRDFESVGCLSGLPTNGYFTTASNWSWYRGAAWKSTQQNAFLPYIDAGLIYYSPVLTLPAINPGENLIMTYNARGACSGEGAIGSLVQNPELISGTSISNFHQTYQNTYTYEDDISSLANHGTWLFFDNPGLSHTVGYSSSDDIYLDNICIFITNRPISSPYQTDPNENVFLDTTCAVGSGLSGLSDCGQVDSIWALFGVNMAYYRFVYAAGTSIWDPIGWVPWLIAAMFVTLADWSCFFLAAYLGLMNFLAWLLNNILNIFDWLRRYLTNLLTYVNAFLEWLQSWFWFFWAVFYDFVTWLAAAVMYWVAFISMSWDQFWSWAATTVMYWVQWIYEALGWLDIWVNGFLEIWAAYFRLQFYFIQEIYNFILAAINMATTFLWWIWTNFISVGQLPISFYWGFDSAFNSTPYSPFVACNDAGAASFWCVFLAGVQIINQTMSQSIFYPIVIVCVILATIIILWRDILGIFSA